VRAPPRPNAVAVLRESRVEVRLQDLQQGLLDETIESRRDAQFAHPAASLGYLLPFCRRGLVRPREPGPPWFLLTRFSAASRFGRSTTRFIQPLAPGRSRPRAAEGAGPGGGGAVVKRSEGATSACHGLQHTTVARTPHQSPSPERTIPRSRPGPAAAALPAPRS
jgi:hypothetical protein